VRGGQVSGGGRQAGGWASHPNSTHTATIACMHALQKAWGLAAWHSTKLGQEAPADMHALQGCREANQPGSGCCGGSDTGCAR
jgi:hypothetical protein